MPQLAIKYDLKLTNICAVLLLMGMIVPYTQPLPLWLEMAMFGAAGMGMTMLGPYLCLAQVALSGDQDNITAQKFSSILLIAALMCCWIVMVLGLIGVSYAV